MFRRTYLLTVIFLFPIVTSTVNFAQDSSQVKILHNRIGDSIDRVESEAELKKRELIVNGDSADAIVEIELKDGSELIGKIIEETPEKYVFITTLGIKMDIPKQIVIQVNTIEGEWKNGEFRRSDPNRTRLFFAPTARSLKAGTGYFSVYELFFPFIAVGVTDYLILSGGMSLFPGDADQILYIAPKIKLFSNELLDIGGGILYSKFEKNNFGIAYGVITIGNSFTAFTGGLGWGFENSEFTNSPILMLGGELQLSDHVKLISENWFLPDEDPVISFGVRFFGANLAADFALIKIPGETGGFPMFPWLGFAYNF